jgi:hypothetical protein
MATSHLDTLTVDELIAQLRQEASTVVAWRGEDEAQPWGAV